jgi:hypothetical protein
MIIDNAVPLSAGAAVSTAVVAFVMLSIVALAKSVPEPLVPE